MHERRVPVPPVRRRRSPLDPPPQTWLVVGGGVRGHAVLDAFAAAGVPAMAFERQVEEPIGAAAAGSHPGDIVPDHEVIAIEEIEDTDSWAVTTQHGPTGEINTDYFAGVVLAAGLETAPYVDGEMLNVDDTGTAHLGLGTFTNRHPAMVVVGADDGAADLVAAQGALAASYACVLAADPRRALAFHRRVSGRVDAQGRAELSAALEELAGRVQV